LSRPLIFSAGPIYSLDSIEDGYTFLCLGLPIMFGILTVGASSPPIPAFKKPDPLSITIGCIPKIEWKDTRIF